MEQNRRVRMISAWRPSALAFLTAFVTLFVQVLVHRIISAKLLNNYAFLVISLTMLGFAFSGVVLSRQRRWFLERLDATVATAAALFALSLLLTSVAFYRVDLPLYMAGSRGEFVTDFLRTIPIAVLFALPFAFCGLILGALLAAPNLPTSRIYGCDLAGSALGAFAVIPAISRLGVEACLLAACGAMIVGALALASRCGRRPRLPIALAAVCVLVAGVTRDRLFDMQYPQGSMLARIQTMGSPYGVEYVAWDPVARIELSRIRPPNPRTFSFPALIGEDESFLRRFTHLLTQNNFAFTYAIDYDGRRESLAGINETIYAAAYHASSVARPKVLVIGVGGGFDILTALHADASEVTGVEINGATMAILTRTHRDYFRHWVDDPRVRLVEAEGRHFLTRSPERFDVIQLSGVDSYSGTPGAAHVFSENYLYTSEAFDLYLSRLSENGVLNMMRLEHFPQREMLRAVTTAVGALRRAGVERPADHVMTVTATLGNFTAMLVKKRPFTTVERQQLAAWAAKSRLFAISAGPGVAAERASSYQVFLTLSDPRLEAAFVALYPFDIDPVGDDRPFFFRYSFWSHVLPTDGFAPRAIPVMEYSVLLLLGVLGFVTLICVYLPIRLQSDRTLPGRQVWRYGFFFAGIAAGYMALEIAFLQKFGLFLGHPNYALSVVLAVMLLATGLGAFFSNRITLAVGGVRFVSYGLIGMVLVEYGMILPRLGALLALPFFARVLVVFALVGPIAVCLGVFMPIALERLKGTAPALVPWAWGVNGIFSVVAPIVSVAWSMTWGINALLLVACLTYLAAAPALPPLPEELGPASRRVA